MQNKLLYYKAILSDKDFYKISEFVEKNYGIKLPRTKKAMVQNRLYKRLIATQIPSFELYVKYVFSSEGRKEVDFMLDELTTNKTDFFRERKHYDFLDNQVFSQNKKLKIWSAGCSSGEEPYSIAMLADYKNINYNILASDLSSKMIENAKTGVYSQTSVRELPNFFLLRYFEKLNVNGKDFYKVRANIRQNVKFFKLNFKDANYNLAEKFDIIFFRNVLIYFNLQTQNEIVLKIVDYLKVGGYLFVGHAESLNCKKLPLINIMPSVYKKI